MDLQAITRQMRDQQQQLQTTFDSIKAMTVGGKTVQASKHIVATVLLEEACVTMLAEAAAVIKGRME